MEEIKDFVICVFDTGLQLVYKLWFIPNSLKHVMFPLYKTESQIMKAVKNKKMPQDNLIWDTFEVLRVIESDGTNIFEEIYKATYTYIHYYI